MRLFTCHLVKWKGWETIVLLFFALVTSHIAQAKFIAVSMSAEDNFRNLISSNIEKSVDDRGDEVFIDSADGDFELQVKQVKSYVDAGADAIIILSAGTAEQNPRLFEFAKKVPLIFVNTEPVADLSTMPENTLYVGSNEKESGTMQMKELARLSGYKGNVALLIGEEVHPAAKMRTQDVKDVMAKYSDLKMVKSESGNWARNQAYKIVSEWIKEKVDFNILVANNDEMIIGGIVAIKDAGLNPKDFFTGGIDATQDALREMQQGNLDVTVLQDAVGQGRGAVEAAYKMINHRPVESPMWIPFRLVTPDNYQEFLNQ